MALEAPVDGKGGGERLETCVGTREGKGIERMEKNENLALLNGPKERNETNAIRQ